MGTRGIPNQYGGFEQFAQHLSADLVQRGHHVYVYTSHTHPYQQTEWNGVTLIHCKDWEYKIGTVGQFLYDRNCIADSRKRDFDILLHLGYTSDSIWHRSWPAKTVNIVNMDGLEWKRSKYNWLTRRFLKWAERLAANHADRLVADSLAIQEYLQKKYNKESCFIPYSATLFTDPDGAVMEKFKLSPHNYFLLIARMEPENNIEMIIKGYLAAATAYSLLVIGNTSNRFGKFITSTYNDPKIIYAGALYDTGLLNNLRYHSSLYFHGHSVGGTNPSLLEAMACGCPIAAYDTIFNKAVLEKEAAYFSTAEDITRLLLSPEDIHQQEERKKINLQKISTIYTSEKITNAYEQLMQDAVAKKK